ncbi:MAG: DNA methyltransferase [Candidatus Poribacteria bacterium]|nr:DNA methyltransferase [Candidatus Poribacteria bacterium]
MSANWTNRTMWTGDNLDVMRGMNSDSVDLIYLDPPFNSSRAYEAPIGSEAAGAAFKDSWTLDEIDLAWHGEIADREPALYAVIDAAGTAHSKSMKAYAVMMTVRLLEMRRILKPTGSIYLHCDPTASHYLKLAMDAVFGQANFRNEIVWSHQGSWIQPGKRYPRRHDTILYYSKSEKLTFNIQYEDNAQEQVNYKRWRKYIEADNCIYGRNMPSHDKRFASYLKRFRKEHGREPEENDVVHRLTGSRIGTVQYVKVVDPKSPEKIGYPTQKPIALLKRIVKASSNEGDMVLDPFAGCAAACVAAEKMGRQWVAIDLSPKAAELVKIRAEKELTGLLSSMGGTKYAITHRTDIPKRTDLGKLPNYRTHKHLLFGKQEGLCAGCRAMFPFRNFTIDHIVPRSRGGSDHEENLQLLCAACNSLKGGRPQEFMLAELKRQGVL